MSQSKELESRTKDLMIGTIVYAIGFLVVRVFQIIFLPIITHKISQDAYGYYDLINSLSFIIIPIATVQSNEALYKYYHSSVNKERDCLINSVLFLNILGIVGIAVCTLFLSKMIKIRYPLYIWLFLSFNTLLLFVQKMARAKKDNKKYSVSSIVNCGILLLLQVVFLYVFNMNEDGLLLAGAIGALTATLYLWIRLHIARNINPKYISGNTSKKVIKFSLPLVPNVISWWGMSSINSIFIILLLSTKANGIFAISNRFPSLLATATSVFQFAWTDNVVITKENATSSKINSKIFKNYMLLVFTSILVLLPLIDLVFPFLIDKKFEASRIYVPILLLSSLFSSFSAFMGAGYLSSEKTLGAFTTNVFGMLINIIITISLIKVIGLYAPALAFLIANMVVFFMRVFRMRSFFYINIKWGLFVRLLIMTIIFSIAYYINNTIINIIIFLLSLILFVLYNNVLLKVILGKLKAKKRVLS